MPNMLKTLRLVHSWHTTRYNQDRFSLIEKIDFDRTMLEFEEFINEVEIYVERAKNLGDRAKSTSKLVSAFFMSK
jgi:hypothetical protein